MPDYISTPGGIEPIIIPHVFDLPFVPDAVFCKNPFCPSCMSSAHPEHLDIIEEVESTKTILLADLMLCTDCLASYLVVEYPVIPHDSPIVTRWSVPRDVSK